MAKDIKCRGTMSLQTELVRLWDEYEIFVGNSTILTSTTIAGFIEYLRNKEIDGVHVHTVDNPEDSYCTYCRAEIHELAKKIRKTIDPPHPKTSSPI